MGLLDLVVPGGSAMFDAVRGQATGMFSGMAGAGSDPRAAIAGATQGMQQGMQRDDAFGLIMRKEQAEQQKLAEAAQQQNATIQWLQENAPEYAGAVQAGVLDPAKAYEMSLGMDMSGPDAPSSVREWEYFNSLDDAQKEQYLLMKRASPWLNTQTEHVRPSPLTGDTTGAPAIPINNEAAARDKAFGTGVGGDQAEVAASAASWESKLPGLKQVVDELNVLADTATYTMGGQLWDEAVKQLGLPPSEAAVARAKYIAMVDNQVLPLLRDTFGAAFTVKEGETLRATLGDPNKSPQEKKAVLEAFIEQKVRDLDALQSRVGGGAPGGGAAADPLGIR